MSRRQCTEQREARLARCRLQYRARRSAGTVNARKARLYRQRAEGLPCTMLCSRLCLIQKALYTTEKVGEVISRMQPRLDRFRSPKMLSIVLVYYTRE